MTVKFSVPVDPVVAVLEPLTAAAMTSTAAAETAAELVVPEDIPAITVGGLPARDVWSAISALVRRGAQPSPLSVAEEMRRAGTAPTGLGDLTKALHTIQQSALADQPVEVMCEVIKRYSIRQRLLDAARNLAKLAATQELEIEQYAAEAEALITTATATIDTGRENSLVAAGDLLAEVIAEGRRAKPGELDGLACGFPDLDAHIQGMPPGEMTIIAARPSMGKTTLAQNIGERVALRGGKVVFCSLEMPAKQIVRRMLSSVGGLDASRIRGRLVTPQEWDGAERRVSALMQSAIMIDDKARTVQDIRRSVLHAKRQWGMVDLVIVDYLQFIAASDRYSGNRNNEVGEISRCLKQLARETGAHIIVISQLSRAVETRPDHRPMLSDLRDSGVIEQDADLVLLLYRDDYYNPGAIPGVAEVIIGKHRNGRTGVVKLGFDPARVRFYDLDLHH